MEYKFKAEKISLPDQVWKVMNWDEETQLEIWVNAAHNELIIRRHTFVCIFCGETKIHKEFRAKGICADCDQQIANL